MATLSLIVDPTKAEQGYRRAEQAGDRYKRSARETLTATDRVRGSFSRLSQAAFSLQGALVGIGAGLAIRQTIRAFSDFERGLIGVGKTADLEGRELEALGDRIQEISRTVPVATQELLGIAQAAGQLGVKGVENISRFAEVVGKLGLASDLAGEEAATSLARILTVTGTAISDVDRLGSTIVQLGNNFAATEAEISRVATRVAQATAQFGVAASETLGIGAALRAVGVEAEAGGTQVGLAFQSINDALRGGGEELQSLARITGQTAEDMRAAFFGGEATSVFQSFVEGLGRIQASGGDVASALEELDLKGVRAVQVMGTLATRSEVLGDALGQANNEWDRNTALTREALVASESFSAQMTLVGNAIDEAAVEIGRELAPAILDATQQFRDFVLEAKEAGTIADTARDVGDAMGWLADNIELVSVGAGVLVGMRLGSVFGFWGAAIGAVAGGFASLAAATDTSTEAQRDYNKLIRDAQGLLDGPGSITDLTRQQSEARLKDALAIREQTKALIDQERQTLEQRQAALEGQALSGSARFSGLADTLDANKARLQDLNEVAAETDSQISFLQARINSLGSGGDPAGAGGGAGGGGLSTALTSDQKDDFEKLTDKIIPAVKAQREYGEAVKLLDAAMAAGEVSFMRYNLMLETLDQNLDEAINGTSELTRAQFEASRVNSELRESTQAILDGADAWEKYQKAAAIDTDVRDLRKELIDSGVAADDIRRLTEERRFLLEAQDEALLKLEEERRAMGFLEQAGSRSFDRIGSAITEAFTKGEDAAISFKSVARAVISELTQSFIELAAINPIKNALFRTSGNQLPTLDSVGGIFGDLFSGLGGSTMTTSTGQIFAGRPGFAHGGDHMGGLRVVGERGPEIEATGPSRIFNAQQTKQILSGGERDGDTYFIDARGADNEGLARVERTIRELNGSIERRAIQAVAETSRRNPKFLGGR